MLTLLRLILQQIRDLIPIRDPHGIWREDGDGDARRIVLRCRLEFKSNAMRRILIDASGSIRRGLKIRESFADLGQRASAFDLSRV